MELHPTPLYTSSGYGNSFAREVIMGRIAPRKNTSPGFSLPGLDGLREKWRRRFGPDDNVSRPAVESEERAPTGESVKRTPGQNTGAQDSLPAASTEDATYALAIGSAAEADEPYPSPIGSADIVRASRRDVGTTSGRYGTAADDAPEATPIGSAGHRPDYLTDVPPRTSAAPTSPSAGAALRGQALLATLWHLPDGFNWMRPLPLMHRRWLLIIALLVAIALLWPYSPTTPPAPVARNDAASSAVPSMQAELVDNSAGGGNTDERHVQTYRIVDGQTLAQLFRAHNLPVADVFAMAQVEGNDKPLSSLQAGQEVRIVQNAQGVVTLLEIETGAAGPVRFALQPDGSYQRR
ncbi:LysM-like peptidoglycan-binding domain-containing protein [Sodalis sp.]|uniref:LysM-like peptidoglycan-binding domain-containing protein n=1 Tax=Sodalis sp. (in: enterobacteria) TaxID=1898979 RepID=UPI00387358E7